MNTLEITENERLLSVRDVAELVGCHKNTIWNWSRIGIIPKPLAFGNLTRWKLSEITAWIDNQERR